MVSLHNCTAIKTGILSQRSSKTFARLQVLGSPGPHHTTQWETECVSASIRLFSSCLVLWRSRKRQTRRATWLLLSMHTMQQSMKIWGVLHFLWCSGREPHLHLDVTMALPLREEVASKYYAVAFRDRLQKAYHIAKACSEEASRRQKRNYDVRVREAILAPSDRVLVKAVEGHKGKHKLSDVWEDETYRVQSQPNHDVPVYVVQHGDGHGWCRTLHYNMLLPVGHLEFWAGTETRQMPSSRQRQRTWVMRAWVLLI